MANNVKESLSSIMQIDGALGASIVDYTTGMTLGKTGAGVDLDLAGAGNTEVVKAKLRTMKTLGLNENIEDILITLDSQFHIIRPSVTHKGLFLYIVLDKDKANLALARRSVLSVEQSLVI
jgi:hypothetical protein